MPTYVDRLCRCGGVGCGRTFQVRDRNCNYPRQFKAELCPTCRDGCRGHYEGGVNIPARKCSARARYDSARPKR